MAMSKSDTGETQKGSSSVVQHIVYRVPKRYHDSMLRLCEEANDIFIQNGTYLYIMRFFSSAILMYQ